MNTRRLSIFFSLVAGLTLIGAGADSSFGQGKGKGNGGGKHGGGNPHGGGGKHGGGHPGRGSGKHGGFVQQAPHQPQPVYQGNPGRGRGAEKRAARQVIVMQPRQHVYVQQQPNVYYQPQMRGNGKIKHKKEQDFPSYGGYKNYGQQRKAEVHQRNAERKAYKEEQKAARRYQQAAPEYYPQPSYRQVVPRDYDDDSNRRYYEDRQRQEYERQQYAQRRYSQPRYAQPQYGQPQSYLPYNEQPYDFYSPANTERGYNEPYYGDADRDFDGADILRTIVFTVLSGGDLDALGGLASNGYLGQISPDYGSQYARNSDGYGYIPAGTYGGGYQPSYGYNDLETLPLQLLSGRGSGSDGSDLFQQIFSQLLAVGYEQGYQQGLAARRTRESEGAFYDPYAYDNDAFDPYSTSLGENRRLLSQGYGLGFEDAMNNVQGYEQFENGDIDLVSILLGAVSQIV